MARRACFRPACHKGLSGRRYRPSINAPDVSGSTPSDSMWPSQNRTFAWPKCRSPCTSCHDQPSKPCGGLLPSGSRMKDFDDGSSCSMCVQSATVFG